MALESEGHSMRGHVRVETEVGLFTGDALRGPAEPAHDSAARASLRYGHVCAAAIAE